MQLTKTQYKVWALLGIGFSADEIADTLHIEVNTARKHIDDIKKRVGLNKNTELAGAFICEQHGEKFNDFKKKILALLLVCFLVINMLPDTAAFTTRTRRTQRTNSSCTVRRAKRETGNLFEFKPILA